jgi:hypothetical protein
MLLDPGPLTSIRRPDIGDRLRCRLPEVRSRGDPLGLSTQFRVYYVTNSKKVK